MNINKNVNVSIALGLLLRNLFKIVEIFCQ